MDTILKMIAEDEKKSEPLMVYLDKKMKRELSDYARVNEVPVSKVIRALIAAHLEKHAAPAQPTG